MKNITESLLRLEHELEVATVLTDYPIRNAVADLRSYVLEQIEQERERENLRELASLPDHPQYHSSTD